MGNQKALLAYHAQTLEWINNSPFASMQHAVVYLKVNYRTISRHLDTKLATTQHKKDYFFLVLVKKKSPALLEKKRFDKLTYQCPQLKLRTQVNNCASVVYKVGGNNILTLPNQPFKTKREALAQAWFLEFRDLCLTNI